MESTNTTAFLIISFKAFLYISVEIKELKFLTIIRDSKSDERVFCYTTRKYNVGFANQKLFLLFWFDFNTYGGLWSVCVSYVNLIICIFVDIIFDVFWGFYGRKSNVIKDDPMQVTCCIQSCFLFVNLVTIQQSQQFVSHWVIIPLMRFIRTLKFC